MRSKKNIITTKTLLVSLIMLMDIVIFCSQAFGISQINTNQSDVVEITINPAPNEEGNYLFGAELEFTVVDHDYNRVEIQLVGSTRAFKLTLRKGLTNLWSAKWNTEKPSEYEDPVPPDTYEVILIINYLRYNCNPDKIIITTEGPNLAIILIILIPIIGGVAASAFVVINRNKKKKQNALEFGAVDKAKKKKKSEIYSGASSIGKRSGQLAEGVAKSKIADLEDTQNGKSSIKSKLFAQVKKPSDQPKQMMPADTSFTFESTVTPSAFLIKDMESKMDLESKIKFQISKTETAVQSIDIVKALLSQQEMSELRCPKCNEKMSKYWNTCPYCKLKGWDELALKFSLLEMSGDVKFCPNCKQIIKPNWITCPICFLSKTT